MELTNEMIAEAAAQGKCCFCGEKFSDENVFTALGWEETKISGMCEVCFDGLFEGMDDED